MSIIAQERLLERDVRWVVRVVDAEVSALLLLLLFVLVVVVVVVVVVVWELFRISHVNTSISSRIREWIRRFMLLCLLRSKR